MNQPSPRLTYVGHATVLVEMDGVRVLTDPVLRQQVGLLQRCAPAIDPACWQGIDAVLISHLHHDHLDRASLELLGKDVRLIVPPGAGPLLRSWGFRQIEELPAGRSTVLDSISVEATPAAHSGFRPPFGPTAACLGFVLRGSRQVYFAGDTDLFPDMQSLATGLDVALLPVWGWGPTLGPGHLDPYRAAVALTLLRPRCAVPVHWGSLAPVGMRWLRPALRREPPIAFARHAAEIAPAVEVCVVPPGGLLPADDWR